MWVSARVDLATRILLDLACEASPRSCRQLALRAGVPASSLSVLLHDLHRAGIVQARRGRFGGYSLARDADDITLADVILALEGVGVPFGSSTPLAPLWDRLRVTMLAFADCTTVAQLASTPSHPHRC